MKSLARAWRWLKEEREAARRDGNLAPWHTLARRFVALPLLLLASFLLYVTVWAGWGREKAGDVWDDLNLWF